MKSYFQLWIDDCSTVAAVFGVRPMYRAPFQMIGEPLMADIGEAHSRVWPDLMRTNQFTVSLFSERWVIAASEQKWTGIEFWPVKIREIDSKYLSSKPHPPYYWAKPIGKKGTNGLPNTGDDIKPDPSTGHFQRPKDSPREAWVDSFVGEETDFFYLSNIWAPYIFCSERIRNTAIKQRWINVDFAPSGKDDNGSFFVI